MGLVVQSNQRRQSLVLDDKHVIQAVPQISRPSTGKMPR